MSLVSDRNLRLVRRLATGPGNPGPAYCFPRSSNVVRTCARRPPPFHYSNSSKGSNNCTPAPPSRSRLLTDSPSKRTTGTSSMFSSSNW